MPLLGNAASGNAVLAQDILAQVVASSYLISGTTPSTSANLTLTYGAQEAVVNNATLAQYIKLAAGTLAITASKDAYIDLGYSGTHNGGAANGTLTKVEVANGAAAPAVTANSIRLWKVVSSGTAITAVTLLATTQPVSGTMVQTGTASGVLGLSAQSLPNLRNGGTPTVAVGANAGTGATASVNAGSTDACGVITINTGTGTTGGTYATVTFSVTLAAAPKLVLLGLVGAQLTNAPASGSYTTTSFVITANMAASTTFQVGYLVIP